MPIGFRPLSTCRLCQVVAVILILAPRAAANDDDRQPGDVVGTRVDGYRGIWHGQEPTGDAFSYKYSGGLATYTAKHIPLAIHAAGPGKTFFVYGGQKDTGRQRLLAMIGCYDHATGQVQRPTLVHDKGTFDPHDNPSLSMDADGHLWVFISGRGRRRAGWIYRSEEPYDIDKFRLLDVGEYTYPQPWHLGDDGFLFLFTKYLGGRQLFFKTSPDGRSWSDDVQLAAFGGHYQLSWVDGNRVATAFNWHPGGTVNKRTNLYYVETRDAGRSWQTAAGETIELPLTDKRNAALVHDYEADGKLVYVNDLKFDRQGRPVLEYVVSNGWAPGPANDPRHWTVARFKDGAWELNTICASDHNYDTGLLDIDEDAWRVIGPTTAGQQAYHTGGELAMWQSTDEGQTWTRHHQITAGSPYNHGYVRPVLGAADDFFALWSDGDPSQPSPCRLYFCDRLAEHVWQLPEQMDGPTAKPIPIALPKMAAIGAN